MKEHLLTCFCFGPVTHQEVCSFAPTSLMVKRTGKLDGHFLPPRRLLGQLNRNSLSLTCKKFEISSMPFSIVTSQTKKSTTLWACTRERTWLPKTRPWSRWTWKIQCGQIQSLLPRILSLVSSSTQDDRHARRWTKDFQATKWRFSTKRSTFSLNCFSFSFWAFLSPLLRWMGSTGTGSCSTSEWCFCCAVSFQSVCALI